MFATPNAAGFDRHLTKPVDPWRLATVLRDINAADLPRMPRPVEQDAAVRGEGIV